MIEKISWVEADASNTKVAALVAGLTNKSKNIESGGCGCGCGDGSVRRIKAKSDVRQA
jgi:hypothetical protein